LKSDTFECKDKDGSVTTDFKAKPPVSCGIKEGGRRRLDEANCHKSIWVNPTGEAGTADAAV